VPFFPTEATERKGLNTAQVGVIIGGFQLVIFLLCPLIGKNVGAATNIISQFVGYRNQS
jgi:hypothetical protein